MLLFLNTLTLTLTLTLFLNQIIFSLSRSPMEVLPSDPPKSPEKQPPPSDQITIKTPNKLPNPRPTIKNPRNFPLFPEKYETLLRNFDALEASLKLLQLRKSVPVFSKIRVMVENISERRFTHQHLAQLKFLLPEEIGVRKVLFPDEESRCMTHDLHLTLNKNSATNPKKRKRGSRYSYLREILTSKLSQFLRAHPQGTDLPEGELPEPFNQKKHSHLLNTFKKSSSVTFGKKVSNVAVETPPAHASHLSLTFKRHFSKGGLGNRTGNTFQSSSVPPFHPPSISNVYPAEKLKCATFMPRRERSEQPTTYIKQKPSAVGEACSPKVMKTHKSPLKSGGIPIKPATPALQISKCTFSPDSDFVSSACKTDSSRSCARSLIFEDPSSISNVKLQLDEAECSDILDILPENVLESLKAKTAAKAKRKQMVAQLPKLFDRIQFLFQGPNSSAIKKEVLIHALTERHSDITDESEIEEQLAVLQEIIPEWVVRRYSPSGNIMYSINRTLKPDSLRQQLGRAV